LIYLTKQERLVFIFLAAALAVGAAVKVLRGERAPPPPRPLEAEFDLAEVKPPPFPVKVDVGVDIKPIEFKIGALRNVKVDFSGAGGTDASWYLNKDGIQNDLTVFLGTRKHKGVKTVTAEVSAIWQYKPGKLSSSEIHSDCATITIYPE